MPDLGELQKFIKGFKQPYSRIDGKAFEPVKVYKDSKVCNVLTMRELDRRYYESIDITFSSLYPGGVATTTPFCNHYPLFKKLFLLSQKHITKGFVSEELAEKRVAAFFAAPEYNQSRVYWSWGNR